MDERIYTVGARIYYTGDMANPDGYARVTTLRAATRFAPESVDITFEHPDCRVIKGLTAAHFAPVMSYPGAQRFWLADDWHAYQARRHAEAEEQIRKAAARRFVPHTNG